MGQLQHEEKIASCPSQDQSSQRQSSYLCWEHGGWRMRVRDQRHEISLTHLPIAPYSILHTPSYVLQKLRSEPHSSPRSRGCIFHHSHQSMQYKAQIQSGRDDEATFLFLIFVSMPMTEDKIQKHQSSLAAAQEQIRADVWNAR